MANSGPNTGSSQFFINVIDNNYLDTKHPVFGNVISGMDVVDAVKQGDQIIKVTVNRKRNHEYKPTVMGRR
jgi:cyclophilin family peptidyl-prolyl cis-trans isomerase